MIVERTDFISVPVTDMERSVAWYRDTLGLQQVGKRAFPEFQLGENVSLYLMKLESVEREWKGPHDAPIALRVADVDGARRELEAKGIEFFGGPTFDTGVCHMAHFTDPDGNVFMLHRRYAPRD